MGSIQLPEKPRIAVVGTGAVGGYYGGKLVAKGHDVHFLLRSDLKPILTRGLELRSVEEGNRVIKVKGYASAEEIGPVDLVIVALKTTSNEALKKILPPLLHQDTAIITLQNGLGNEAFLAENFGGDRVMGGLCFVCLNRVAPGVIEHYGHGTISIGEYLRAPQPRTRALGAWLLEAGVEAHLVENLLTERWRKLIWNIPFNGLSIAAGGVTTDQILADPHLERLVRGLMRETIEIARARGHEIPDSYADHQIARTRPMGAYRPSSLLDYWDHRPVEVEPIWGEPLREAERAGLDAGRLEALYVLVKRLVAEKLAARRQE